MRLIDADEFQKQIAGMAILNNYPQGEPYKVVAWMLIPERYKG